MTTRKTTGRGGLDAANRLADAGAMAEAERFGPSPSGQQEQMQQAQASQAEKPHGWSDGMTGPPVKVRGEWTGNMDD